MNKINLNKLLKIAENFEKLAQITDYNTVLALQNLLKHVPFSSGGKTGTLFGTIALHDQTQKLVDENSGVMAEVLKEASLANVMGEILIQMTVTGNGLVSLSGHPQNLVTRLNQKFSPLLQAAIARLKVGPAADKDCAGLKLPPSGIKFDWIKFKMPATTAAMNASSPNTPVTSATSPGTTVV